MYYLQQIWGNWRHFNILIASILISDILKLDLQVRHGPCLLKSSFFFQAWSKLLSISFNYEEHTSLWTTTFMDDFQDKLKEVRLHYVYIFMVM